MNITHLLLQQTATNYESIDMRATGLRFSKSWCFAGNPTNWRDNVWKFMKHWNHGGYSHEVRYGSSPWHPRRAIPTQTLQCMWTCCIPRHKHMKTGGREFGIVCSTFVGTIVTTLVKSPHSGAGHQSIGIYNDRALGIMVYFRGIIPKWPQDSG